MIALLVHSSVLILASIGFCSTATSPVMNMKYIEAALANISAQVAADHSTDKAISHSLTSVTSLLQLTLLKEMLANSAFATSGDEQEGTAFLQKVEGLVVSNQKSIIHLQEEVTALFSALNSVKNDVRTILRLTRASINNSIEDESTLDKSLPHSCAEIKASSPSDIDSGYYTIVDDYGQTRHMYCQMEEMCGSSDGWTRIADLNMSHPGEKCPEGFKLYEVGNVRACGKDNSGCVSTTFPSYGISYSEVCGKVVGYQYGNTAGAVFAGTTIENHYIDGISLTHGNPRTHVWSFVSGNYEAVENSACPCGIIGARGLPSFVDKHYFCESATVPNWKLKLYTDDPLWDGKRCGPIEGPCCNLPGLPWFHRSLAYTTSDSIELRVCSNSGSNLEDIPVSFYEIYVK